MITIEQIEKQIEGLKEIVDKFKADKEEEKIKKTKIKFATLSIGDELENAFYPGYRYFIVGSSNINSEYALVCQNNFEFFNFNTGKHIFNSLEELSDAVFTHSFEFYRV